MNKEISGVGGSNEECQLKGRVLKPSLRKFFNENHSAPETGSNRVSG